MDDNYSLTVSSPIHVINLIITSFKMTFTAMMMNEMEVPRTFDIVLS